jgi:hypothetical protein
LRRVVVKLTPVLVERETTRLRLKNKILSSERKAGVVGPAAVRDAIHDAALKSFEMQFKVGRDLKFLFRLGKP